MTDIKITTNREISSGDRWCVAVNGWYLKSNGSNITFATEKEALEYIERMQKP